MADSTNLYKILGVSKNASSNDIRKAYRRRYQDYKFKNTTMEDQQKKMELSHAYEVLSDPNKRAIYDQCGVDPTSAPQNHSRPFSFLNLIDADEIVGSNMGFPFFGGMPTRMPQKKKDSIVELTVTLEDLYNGSRIKIPIGRDVICAKCSGVGGNAHGVRQCAQCHGRGKVMGFRQLAPGFSCPFETNCAVCKGQGIFMLDRDKCNRCAGHKIMKQTESLEVQIIKGMKDKQKLRFQGKGDEGVAMEPGDYYVVLDQVPHGTFKRKGDDLLLKLNVSLADALCGFQKIITQLDGRTLLAKLEPGAVLVPGCIKQIENEGMPLARSSYHRGNLIIEFQVDFPENHFCDEVSLKLLEKLLPPRPVTSIPNLQSEDVEEVTMFDLSSYDEEARPRMEAYGSDEEDTGPNHLRCAHQ